MLDLYKMLLLKKFVGDSGGGEAVLINKTITSNGTYNASDDSADGFKKVIANVPNTYSAGDEGKVVSNGSLVAQTAHAQVTQNGTIDTTLNNSVEVAVPVPTLESKSVSANGTYTPESGKAWNEVVVNLPNGIRDWRVYTGTCTTTSVTKSFTFDTGITGTSRLITTIGFCQQDVSELPLASTASSNAYADQICGWACAYGLTAANILVNGYSCGSTWSNLVFRRKDDGTNDYYQSGTSISIDASTGKVTVSNSRSDTAFMPGITFDWMIVVGVSS